MPFSCSLEKKNSPWAPNSAAPPTPLARASSRFSKRSGLLRHPRSTLWPAIVLVESAIDAISCFALYPEHRCISTAGADPTHAGWLPLSPKAISFYCGFDADSTGEAMAHAMIALHPTSSASGLLTTTGTTFSRPEYSSRLRPSFQLLGKQKPLSLERRTTPHCCEPMATIR